MDFFFLNPWAMVAGGALVSSPIIIHLINRMRFKRIRWAAMEFLLKSQKRNRRRLIIEQLILLLLRILIVLFLGFLLARFVLGGQTTGQNTTHVVILDDSLSMTDRWSQNGEPKISFDVGKEMISKLAKESAKANSAQYLKVLLLSEVESNNFVFDQRLGDTSLKELDTALASQKPTALHLKPIDGIKRAEEIFQDTPQNKHVLHIVSDFRDNDWVAGPDAKALGERVDALLDAGISLTLLDAAHPYRGPDGKEAEHHENMAILDFKAESKLVAEAVPVEFAVTLVNYSPSQKSTFLTVKVNGDVKFEASRPIEQIAPNIPQEYKFSLVFAKKVVSNPAMAIRDNDTPEERERKRLADREFFHVSAEISDEPSGLRGDNIRDLVIEVRQKVPALVVDGNPIAQRVPGGDMFHVEVAFTAARSFEAERREVKDLAKMNLDLYPTIYLLNVAEIKDEAIVAKLDDYVKKGGSLVYFLGDQVQAGFYNDVLHKQKAGLFPILLKKPSDELTDDEKRERRQVEEQPKILFPDKNDEMVKGVAPYETIFRFLGVDRYWEAQPEFLWLTNADEPVKQIIVLPNRKDMDNYKAPAQALMKSVVEATTALAQTKEKEKEFAKYVPVVEKYQSEVRAALGLTHPYHVSVVLDRLLNDPGNEKDPEKQPNMAKLWDEPAMKSLKSQIEIFNRTVRFGDPLVVVRPHGKGRVVAALTPAGTISKWNDWGGGSVVSLTFPMFMMDMQRSLARQADDLNHIVGDTIEFPLDAAKYKPTVTISYQPQPDLVSHSQGEGDGGGVAAKDTRPPVKKHSTKTMKEANKILTFTFDKKDSKEPGVYSVVFENVAEGATGPAKDTRMFTFNVDANAESDLRRANEEKLEHGKPSGAAALLGASGKRGTIRIIHGPEDSFGAFKARVPDFSSFSWIFLIILLVLIGEQALAVYLSFHLKGSEGSQTTAAPARTPVPVTPAAAA